MAFFNIVLSNIHSLEFKITYQPEYQIATFHSGKNAIFHCEPLAISFNAIIIIIII